MSRHPLHPALVHFPIACWTLAVGADVAGLWLGHRAWQWSGGLLAVGCVVAAAAMVAGLVDLVRVPEGAAMRVAWMHLGAMLLAFSCFLARLIVHPERFQPVEPDMISYLLDAAGFLALAFGGWFGGQLVYRHRVGVDRP